MSDNQFEYDTAAVRREAAKFGKCCDMLDDRALPKVRSIRGILDGNFTGKAARALEQCLEDAEGQIKALRRNCESMCRTLNNYAAALERADREIAQRIRG